MAAAFSVRTFYHGLYLFAFEFDFWVCVYPLLKRLRLRCLGRFFSYMEP